VKELTVSQIKEIQLNILQVIADFCDKNNITYFLGSGTLIGAIRHQGYIPWDDDIDLLMPRPDYEVFISIFNKDDSNFKVFSNENDSKYCYPFAKVSDQRTLLVEDLNENFEGIGINVDIFPIDGLPEKKKEQVKLFKKITIVQKLLSYTSTPIRKERKLYKNWILRIIKLLNANCLVNKLSDLAKSNKYNNAKEVGMIVWSSNKSIPSVSKQVFEKYKLELFEGEEYKVPIGYHQWLTKVYGDYMKLPPEDKRVSHHHFKAYLIE